jgi:hypothetical protein
MPGERLHGRARRGVLGGLGVLAVVCVLGVLGAAGARAQPGPAGAFAPGPSEADYDYQNSEWNGLSDWYRHETARGRRLRMDVALELTSHPLDVPLVLVYPTRALPVPELVAFVERGGRLLVADDFGTSGPLVQALGLTRVVGTAPHRELLRGNADLPVVRAASTHPLLEGVAVVVANHPALLVVPSLRVGPVPVLPFDAPGYGLLYDLSVGEGRAIVLSDPSLLINFMREVGDNARLASNLVDALCGGRDECELAVVSGERGRVRGAGVSRREARRAPPPAEALAQQMQRSARRLNTALEELAHLRPDRRGVYFAGVFLALGVAVFLFSALPLGRPRWLAFSLRLAGGVRSRSEFEWNLERLLEGGRNDDFGLPLAILKDEFEEVFLGALAQHPSELMVERRYDAGQMLRFARRFAERVTGGEGGPREREEAAARALATLRAMARIPSRNSLVPEVDGRYSERLLRRLYGEARGLLGELGVLDRYERRAGRP